MVSIYDQVVFIADSFTLGFVIDQGYSLLIFAGGNLLCGFLLKVVN